MSSSQLSDLDFQRLQENLLELKNQNYSLDAQAKKSKHALGEATARVKVLEEALEKANRTVERSKKAQEVANLMRENEALNQKLRFQEDQFNEQNQTMMKEFCEVIKKNEELKCELESVSKGGNTSSESRQIQPESGQKEDSCSDLSGELEKLRIELNDKSGVLNEKESSINQLTVDKDNLIQEVNHVKEEKEDLSRQVEHLKNAFQDLKQTSESRQQDDFKTIEDLKLQLSENPPDKMKELEAKNICLYNEMHTCKDQLATETHRCNQLAADLANDRQQLETLQHENREAVASLEHQLQTVNTDLEVVNKTCEKRKQLIDKMAQESQALTNQIRDMSIQHENRISDLVKSHEEKICQMETQIDEKRGEISSLTSAHNKEINHIKKTKDEEIEKVLQSKQNHIKSVEEDVTKLRGDLDTKQSVIITHVKQIDSLNQQIINLETEIENLEARSQDKVSELETQLELTNVQKVEFEEKSIKLEGEVRDLLEEKKVVERKSLTRLKELKKELVKEQRRSEKMQEKLKDCFIDTESNHSDQTKDLDADRSSISSWSLMSGQNERDRETSTPCQLSPGLASSYSETSLNNLDHNINRVPRSDGKLQPAVQLQNHLSSSQSNTSFKAPLHGSSSNDISNQEANMNHQTSVNKHPETDLLLEKITALQQDKWRLEENLSMLEQSGAAMADEIVRKNNLIQFYCMDSRKPPETSRKSDTRKSFGSNSQLAHNSTGAEKMKQFVGKLDRLVNSDQQTENHNKEMQRLQQMLEETLTKNMYLQQNMDTMSQEIVRLSKLVAPSD